MTFLSILLFCLFLDLVPIEALIFIKEINNDQLVLISVNYSHVKNQT